jgi:ribosomal protein S18 acetylase RimI-like enzyme
MTRYEVTFEHNPTDEDLHILADGIDQFTQSVMGTSANTPLTFFVRDDAGLVIAGVHGNYGEFGWLYVSSLWVSEGARSSSYGTRLMEHIEAAAIENGCQNAYLDTFSFQAVEFYKRLGYTIFGVLEDFPPEYSRCFLRKRLIQRKAIS